MPTPKKRLSRKERRRKKLYLRLGVGLGGLAIAFFLLLAAGVFARAWEGWSGSLAFAAGWVGTVLALWQVGPGGDILVPALGGWGNVWILGGVVALGLPLMAPSRWFED